MIILKVNSDNNLRTERVSDHGPSGGKNTSITAILTRIKDDQGKICQYVLVNSWCSSERKWLSGLVKILLLSSRWRLLIQSFASIRVQQNDIKCSSKRRAFVVPICLLHTKGSSTTLRQWLFDIQPFTGQGSVDFSGPIRVMHVIKEN